MRDPTRIPAVIAALRRAWEGQPDLSLPALIGIAANRGISWGSSDEELCGVLADMEAEHPALIDAPSGGHYTITTTGPAHIVTLCAGDIVVRSAADAGRIPAVWRAGSMRRTGPGLPLVIADTQGVDHRLGVTTLITAIDPTGAPSLSGLVKGQARGARWLVVLEDGKRAVVGRTIRLWEQLRREVIRSEVAYERIVSCAVGGALEVQPPGGVAPACLGRVERVLLLEA
ncbi:hypothetical protein [Corynebacterium liangguodongii]|uniref:Uncharacterized protein n=1 Tax=Corynebacterium liangguodongii TaxID=2079535 RepID=A0A2S0WC62_9CORY|nr:hypothetical protein [Corynebacterium liangguodongii]AWB83359.1 hypothetical protein C3E79_01705 [Corynebacterium liangguodongii]PWC00551.1 hypothetical protein DF219_01245 [Corynebacterium liangguodongii]